MRLLIVRHGIAEDIQEFGRKGRPDALRPLTDAGHRKMRRAARGLHHLVPELSLLASSPLTRAVQTSKILARRYPDLKTVQIAALSPRKPVAHILEWLQKNKSAGAIALVGHEPHLSMLVGWMVTGLKESFITFKKGGAALLEIEGDPGPGRAKLAWLLKPGQLRDLAARRR
jgi:phosphohistidine phosphatase